MCIAQGLIHIFRFELPLLLVWTDLFFSQINFSLSFSFSLSASPKYPRPLPIPYTDVHPALLSIRSPHYAAFTCARAMGHEYNRAEKTIRGPGQRFKFLQYIQYIATEIVGHFAALRSVKSLRLYKRVREAPATETSLASRMSWLWI